MTVSKPDHPATDDPLASQRLALLGKLVAAQMSLEKVIADLASSGANTSAADAQLSILAGLQASISTASPSALASMSGEIASAIAQSKTLAEQANAATGSAPALADTARASRLAVNDAMEAARHFTLTFASPEDEANYRKREDERARYIAAQNARNSPEGNLNAGGAAIGQLVDAKAHGAHGPEFDTQWKALVETTEKLREQVRASGGSTKEFDDHLRNDLRQIMRSKGLTDAEIDARFAANPDPLEAAKAYVASNDDIGAIKQVAERAANADAPKVAITQPSAQPEGIGSIMESLQSAGVKGGQTPAAQHEPQHGLATVVASLNVGTAVGKV